MNFYNGAENPCVACHQSPNNSVHKNQGQFGYHAYVPEPEKVVSRQAMKVRELLDVILAADPESQVSFELFPGESYAIGNVEITNDGVVLA